MKVQVQSNPAAVRQCRLVGDETRALRREEVRDDGGVAGCAMLLRRPKASAAARAAADALGRRAEFVLLTRLAGQIGQLAGP